MFLLFSEFKFFGHGLIFFKIRAFQIREQAFALADQFVKTGFACKVFRIGFEVIGNILNSFRNQRNLHGGRAGIIGAGLEFTDDVFSVLVRKYHFFVHLGLQPNDQAVFIRNHNRAAAEPFSYY